jgi:hypothetical protein
MTDNDRSECTLTPKQDKLIAALLAGHTMLAAAKIVGCTDKTARAWLEIEQVQRAYKAAKKAAFDDALEQLRYKVPGAISTLSTIMTNDEAPESSRVRAAQIILEQAIEQHQTKELEERIAELELQTEQRTRKL